GTAPAQVTAAIAAARTRLDNVEKPS
ncbi:MAG: hypothetical protein ACI81O_000730, partial [Cyclobacteriaceae bacterium]